MRKRPNGAIFRTGNDLPIVSKISIVPIRAFFINERICYPLYELKSRFLDYQARLSAKVLTVLWNLFLCWILLETVLDVNFTAISYTRQIIWLTAGTAAILIPMVQTAWLSYHWVHCRYVYDELPGLRWEASQYINEKGVEALKRISTQHNFWNVRKVMLDTGVLKARTLIFCVTLLAASLLVNILALLFYPRMLYFAGFTFPLAIWRIYTLLRKDYIITKFLLLGGGAEKLNISFLSVEITLYE